MADLGKTYTSNAGALQDQIKALTNDYTSRINNAPQMQDTLASAVNSTDNAYKPEAQDRGALVQQLLAHDNTLSQKYANQQGNMYIENPMARERALSAATAPMYGAISNKNANLQMLRQIFGSAIDKGMQLYNSQTQAKKEQAGSLMDMLKNIQDQAAGEEDKRRWELQYQLQKEAAAKSGSGTSGIEYSQVPVKTADGKVEMQWAKVDKRTGEVKELIGAIKTPTILEQLKAMGGTEQTAPSTGGSGVRLRDQQGNTYEYDGVNDPDYLQDLGKGFLPQ